ncbi:VPLPA-CTERM sorting domain-containing protein [Roseobacter sp.]|uniref:VPLPA-CTERM sorting domain-containing protein n=1 Tax=Roseobacter sp. TaxID=1907202 RepID=UPI00385B1081
MNIKTLVKASMVAMALSAASAYAATVRVNVDGAEWAVTTLDTTFEESSVLLRSQTWWRPEFQIARDRAIKFSAAVNTGLGMYPNSATNTLEGPLFAFTIDGLAQEADVYRYTVPPSAPVQSYHWQDEVRPYAYAIKISAVPLPAGGVLILTGLAGFAALRRRRKCHRKVPSKTATGAI